MSAQRAAPQAANPPRPKRERPQLPPAVNEAPLVQIETQKPAPGGDTGATKPASEQTVATP
jgi:hypothetical protein